MPNGIRRSHVLWAFTWPASRCSVLTDGVVRSGTTTSCCFSMHTTSPSPSRCRSFAPPVAGSACSIPPRTKDRPRWASCWRGVTAIPCKEDHWRCSRKSTVVESAGTIARSAHSMPFGAELHDDGVRFRLWAPAARRVELVLAGPGDRTLAMPARDGGWFELSTDAAQANSRYRYRINGELLVPDPASRCNPEDVDGPSMVIDPRAFAWSDGDWRGRPWYESVVYELHTGTFSPEGTFAGIASRLDHLAELGVTTLELMPIGDFPGRRGWGYDGVLPFAPDSAYGTPDTLKALVDAAHRRGLAVMLDVVYNHFGPQGNYLHAYAPQFFSDRHHTPWGPAINFDGLESRTVRDFYIHNACYWLEEYHLDGLRFD